MFQRPGLSTPSTHGSPLSTRPSSASCTVEQLREAGTRYGLPLSKLNLLPIKTLQNLVSVSAALACCDLAPTASIRPTLSTCNNCTTSTAHCPTSSTALPTTRRCHSCRRPNPPHSSLRLPFQRTTFTTMAKALSPPSHPTPHLPLPQLPFLQLRLRQAIIFQHPTTATLLPSTWPLLHRLHRHWHPTPRAQQTSQAQATSTKHPRFCRTLSPLLAHSQHH